MSDLLRLWEKKEKKSQQERRYLHFDQKTSLLKAKRFVFNPAEVARHFFYPFIRNDIRTKRFKKDKRSGKRSWEPKDRMIMYASHVDSLIYSYYNILLSEKYEAIIKPQQFQSSILAYRKLGKSNIEFAFEAFQAIKHMGECIALAFDVSKFFDTLDHGILRNSWEQILGESLDSRRDHRNIFNSITRFAYVKKEDLDREFHIEQRRDESGLPLYRYCSGKEFRERVRRKGLIEINSESKGIPQGSPISALLSNIYMLDFDKTAYQRIVVEGSGIYRRYCDDILVVCKISDADEIENWILHEITKKCKLEIQPEKTEKFALKDLKGDGVFRPVNMTTGKRRSIQYLGFEYDGDHIFVRSSSLSRYYRRMKYRVHSAVYDAKKKGGRVFKKGLLLKNTEHGVKIAANDYKALAKTNPALAERRKFRGNFITYAKRAADKMDEIKILSQIKPHRRKLMQTIAEKEKTLRGPKK